MIADVIWISNERLNTLVDEAGHLIGAPEIVGEVLSTSWKDQHRDLQLKLKLYSVQGVQEYWIIDHENRQLKSIAGKRDN